MDWVPACPRLRHVQPAKLAVYQALVHQGLTVKAIAAQRRIQEDSVQVRGVGEPGGVVFEGPHLSVVFPCLELAASPLHDKPVNSPCFTPGSRATWRQQ